MTSWRFLASAILLVVVLWWTYPRRVAESGDGHTEVTVWFNGLIEGRHLEVVDAFEREFAEAGPFSGRYRVEIGSSAVRGGLEGEGNPQRLMCGIAGGVPPEVVEYDRFAICQWASRDAFCDLTPFIEADRKLLAEQTQKLEQMRAGGADGKATAQIESAVARLERFAIKPEDYHPAPWDECKYEGGLYGIPNTMDDRVLYYNSDLLIQAGFSHADGSPKPPDTWEQLLTKLVDVRDGQITGPAIVSASADFAGAGVRPGDTLSHIAANGVVTRCLVDEVRGPHQLTVKSPYPARRLNLADGDKQHIKIFDQDGYCLRLSRWDDEGNLKVLGYEPQHGNGWLFHYGWMNGGEFMSDDGRRCTLDEPRIVEALQFTTDVYDAYGGHADVSALKKSFQAYAQDPFYRNQMAMFLHGDWFLRDLSRYKRDMRFGTYPPPIPRHRLEAGHDKVTWIGGFAWCIPSTCPQEKREAAWWLIKYLSSVTGGMVFNEYDAQRERGQGRLYMPRMTANRKLAARQLEEYVNIPEMPQRVREAMQVHIDMLDHARYRPVSPVGHKLWNAQADAQDFAWNHGATPQEALRFHCDKVQRALDAFFAPPSGGKLQWSWLVGVYVAILVFGAVLLHRRYRRLHSTDGFHGRQWWVGVVFALPWLAGFIVLAGGPMLFSAIMSVTEYDVINEATYVGLDNYREMFSVDWGAVGGVRQTLGNTLYMAIGLPIGMAVGLGLAMLLAAEVRGMSWYRTAFFLPAIMPVVAASVLWIWVFNAQNGLMNWLLELTGIESLLDWLGMRTPISWLTNKHTSKPALIIMGLWSAGASMIIWLAGLREIPQHLYEAAALDGAGPVRRFATVTLPMLSPYILFNLVIGLIGTFQIFTQAYIMTPNGSPERSTYFYVYKLFDECFSYFRLGYGAAMAWVLFVIVIVLTLMNMILSRKWVYYAGD